MELHLEEVKKAADEIRRACEDPDRLVANLARLVSRKKRRDVISDNWSYLNQLRTLLRGYTQARGHVQWADVGRTVLGDPFFIVKPRFGTSEEIPKAGKPRKNAKPVKKNRLVGFMGVPVWGLEQTKPAEDYHLEEKYSLFPDVDKPEYVRVFDGYKVPWYDWYSALRPDVDDQLTAHLGAAIVAELLDKPTELDDLLRKLREADPADIAKRIDRACKAVAAYLAGKDPQEGQSEREYRNGEHDVRRDRQKGRHRP